MNDNWWAIASLILSLAFTGLGWRLLASGRRFYMPIFGWRASLFSRQGRYASKRTRRECVPSAALQRCSSSSPGASISLSDAGTCLPNVRAWHLYGSGYCRADGFSLLIGRSGADVQGTHDFWVTAHVGIAMMSYGAGGLAAAAGAAFCMQNECLKRHRIPGTCRVLPPIRTLEASMKRLVLVAFLLLLLGEWLGWRGNLPINAAKTSIVILLTAGYSVLLWFIYRRGIPGRMLACCCVALFIASMSIFLVS